MTKFLIIQTAFTGDVVLATAVAEKLHQFYPGEPIDFLVRKGNEGLLKGHPFIRKVWVWNKQNNKRRNLWHLIFQVRKEKYDYVINLHRFTTSGILTCFSGAKNKIGFDKNPFSFCFTKKLKHLISLPGSSNPVHETQRNQGLIAAITDEAAAFPRLYPTKEDQQAVAKFQQQPYICIAASSVWFTKQFPVSKWVSLFNVLPATYRVYFIGGSGDGIMADDIIQQCENKNVKNLCGQLNYLQSAALMQQAEMNYVNDSAPLHFASAMNAPVTAVYCSTVPEFGFGPLRENARVVEIGERLYCRPCGLHGRKACPEGHFRCAMDITNEQLLWWISKKI